MSSPDPFTPTCSVVICTRDRPETLDVCLKAVTALDYPQFDVLVVDNAPSDDRARAVAERWSTHTNVRYVVEPVRGVSRARNLGAHSCGGEIVAYTDDDALPEADWLRALVREFEDARVMAVAGQVLPPVTGDCNALDARVRSLAGCGQAERLVVDRDTPYWFEMANFGGIGDGNMAFRRQAFEVWPGFDVRLGRGASLLAGEEHYAFYQLIERGWRVVYTPASVLRHRFPATFRGFSDQHRKIVTEAAAYATLLFVEQPGYRSRLLQYAARSLNGGQPWQRRIEGKRPHLFPRWHKLYASLAGPWIYVRSMLSQK
jgi:cellulose synthase/poly-beta-1,6-N-acetylglucosamine synthase-like glycosyltransferase